MQPPELCAYTNYNAWTSIAYKPDKYRNLVLLPDLYDSLYLPRPMVPLHTHSPRKGQPMGADADVMTPEAALGCSTTATCMHNFAATSMEQENETDWDSEPDEPMQKFWPVGMSDQNNWGEDDLDMGDHLTCANEPPSIQYGCIKGASSRT